MVSIAPERRVRMRTKVKKVKFGSLYIVFLNDMQYYDAQRTAWRLACA